MAKYIKLTDDIKKQVMAEFQKSLDDKMCNGNFNFSYSSPEATASMYVTFSAIAWSKMFDLIDEFSTEVQWHCTAHREDECEIYIDDVLMFNQKVTSVTVDVDQEKYVTWLNSLDDDTFNSMRVHGHSHVNMSTSPSSVDLNFQNDKLKEMTGSCDFYVFIIANKKREVTIKVFDLKNNLMYGDKDIIYDVDYSNMYSSEFIKEAKEMVETPKVSYTVTTPAVVTSHYNKNKNAAPAATEKKEWENWARCGYEWGYDI